MRATILLLTGFMLCHLTAWGSVFVFKNGKSIEGSIQNEDESTIRIREKSGVEMTLRKSELNLAATGMANATQKELPVEPASSSQTAPITEKVESKPAAKVYTNRDVKVKPSVAFTPPEQETSQAWQRTVSKLEREFTRLQGACRGAGTGPNISKVLRSHTYNVNGKQVRVTGYWADPANIEQARQICERAINTEEALQQARRGFQDFLKRQQDSGNSLTAQ